MAITNRIVLAVRWSVKDIFAPDSPISRKKYRLGKKINNIGNKRNNQSRYHKNLMILGKKHF